MSEMPAGDARLVDRSLTHVDQRRGVGTSMLALGRHTTRRVSLEDVVVGALERREAEDQGQVAP